MTPPLIGHLRLVIESKRTYSLPFRLDVLVNPENQGYGGNQKLGYHYALNNDFDFVALLHGDGQYAPEFLPALVEPLREGSPDAVFGSRMLVDGAARTGGMPLYKFVGNKILTWFENRILRTKLSEFHSGYRIYSTGALRRIPFERNTNDFSFRYRSHYSATHCKTESSRVADFDLLRRRDLPRQWDEVRARCRFGGAEGSFRSLEFYMIQSSTASRQTPQRPVPAKTRL